MNNGFNSQSHIRKMKGAKLMTHSNRRFKILAQSLRKILVLAVAVLLLSWSSRTYVQAAGDLDLTFGTNGKVTTKFPGGFNEASAVVVQPDGKIVAAGRNSGGGNADFALARYNVDGSLDSAFGLGGKVVTDFFITSDIASSLVLQSDGKIIVAGLVNNFGFGLARYNVDGSLDPTFGNGGKVTSGFPLGGALAVALQSDGKIVAAGIGFGGSDSDFALARFNSDGSLDTTFGTGGRVLTDFGSSEGANAIAIQPDGKILAGGGGRFSSSLFDFELARYNVDGSLDSTFGAGGKVTTDFFGNFDSVSSMALQADGKVVVAGTVTRVDMAFNSFYGLARYNTNGSLDTTFGSGGKVATNFNGNCEAHGVAIRPDGKIVAAGITVGDLTGADFGLVRYNIDGSLDTTFGSKGKVVTDFGRGSGANALALQPDGKTVAAGSVHVEGAITVDFALARYNSDGGLDPGFGAAGKVTTTFFSETNIADALAVQPDGKIVVVGLTRRETTSGEFALARFNPDGRLDPSFGSGGQVVTDLFESEDRANAVAIQPDGKIVVAGSSFTTSGSEDFALVRYNQDGSLDTSFGTGGKVTTNFSGFDEARAIALQPDGKITVAGRAQTGFDFSDFDFALVRYNIDGSLDPAFGSGGKVTTDFFGNPDGASALAIQPDGKIVAAGSAQINPFSILSDFAIARYNANGSPDSGFGDGGKLTTDFFGSVDQANALAIQPDGKIVATGSAFRNTSDTSAVFALARYNSDGDLDTDFGDGGKVTTTFFEFSAADARAIVIEPDNKILVAGSAEVDFSTSRNFALARYNADGSPDPGFGEGGKLTTDFFGSVDRANALAIQPDGKVVAAGSAIGGIGSEFAVARYITRQSDQFDICMQDDASGDTLQINSTTGDYKFTRCGSNTVLNGIGVLFRRGSRITLQHNTADRRVLAKIDSNVNKGSASIQMLSPSATFTIVDRNISNNTCSCPSASTETRF